MISWPLLSRMVVLLVPSLDSWVTALVRLRGASPRPAPRRVSPRTTLPFFTVYRVVVTASASPSAA